MDGNLEMANQFENNGNSPICERCESNAKELFMCERCERMICSKCTPVFTQFSSIDYNCCKSCAESELDRDDN